MRRTRPTVAATGLACALALAAAAPSVAPAATAGATRSAMSAAMLSAGGASGAYAIDLQSGAVLYARNADVKRIPASVQKLYTTSTALVANGPKGRLRTTVLAEGIATPDGRLEGDLVLKGAGDPSVDRADLAALARDVAAAGITDVRGRVLGDETVFDALRGPGYPAVSSYVGVLSGLPLGRGFTSAGAYQSDPAAYVAGEFRSALRAAGVKVRGAAAAGRAGGVVSEVAAHEGATVRTLSRAINVPSDNYLAETLIKVLGAGTGTGSTRAGAQVVADTMARTAGTAPAVADGSGLSRSNATSPREVVALLRAMSGSRDPIGRALRSSLALAGKTGTIRSRMRGTAAAGRCQAKTGTLSNVSALAGYCRSTSGRRTAFAILHNQVGIGAAHGAQDRMAAALARYTP